MSATELKVSERDAVMRERAAYVTGVIAVRRALTFAGFTEASMAEPQAFHSSQQGDSAEETAAKVFPMPKVKRPRVVRDPMPGYTQGWRCVGGQIEYNPYPKLADHWQSLMHDDALNGCRLPTVERIKVWADLLATPDELVDDE
jgi:hypothetical protein